ncbi:Transmembrane proteins 14C family protein [Acanthocheilonema viteae]
MNMSDLIDLTYAGIIIVGGLVGYFKAGSTVSLAAGLAFGGAAGFAAYFKNNLMLLAVSSGLTLLMGTRFIQSGKIMPSGIITILSFAMVFRCLMRYIHLSKSADDASLQK